MRTGWGTIASLVALAAVGRLAFVWWPNVALTYFVVFAAGVAFGAVVGGLVGLLSMLATNVLLTGFHPVLLVNTPAMALLGVAGGLLGRAVDFGQRGGGGPVARAAAALAGVVGVVVFSVASDAASFALFLGPAGAPPSAFRALLVAGLAFNAIPAAVNGVVFATALQPSLAAARAAGLLAAPPGPDPGTTPAREPEPSP